MISLKENVFSHLPILLPQLISDVETGIGIIKNVLAAQRDGLSIKIAFVFQLLTNAPPMLKMDHAFHATRVMILKTELAFTQLSITPSPLIPDVPPGIGTTKSALFAH